MESEDTLQEWEKIKKEWRNVVDEKGMRTQEQRDNTDRK